MKRVALLLLICGGVAQAVPPGTWTESVDRQRAQALVGKATAALSDGDQRAAQRHLEAAAETRRTDPTLWQRAGDLAFRLDDAKRALHCWKAVAAMTGPTVTIQRRIAFGLSATGDHLGAAELHAWVAEKAPLDSLRVIHFGAAAEAAALAGDFTAGERWAKRARDLARTKRQRIGAALAQAYVYLLGLEYDEAEGLYDEVLLVDPDNAFALNNLGNIHYMRHDFDTAAEHFIAIMNNPDADPDGASIASANLAELSLLRGKYDDAKWLYEQARTLQPRGAWSFFGLAALADVRGDHDQAINWVIDGWERDESRLTRLNTVYVQPEWRWQQEALLAEVQGDIETAVQRWQRVARGDVEALRPAAHHHLAAIAAADAIPPLAPLATGAKQQ